MEERILPVAGILGSGTAIAAGFAWSLKRAKKDGVVVTVIGDGASNEGAFYEGINIAANFEAPIVFFIENNGMGVSVPIADATKLENLSEKGAAVGITGVTVDGSDAVAVREATEAAINKARAGQPSIVEAKTYRCQAHSEGMVDAGKPDGYMEAAKENDPIKKYEKMLEEMGLVDTQRKAEIHKAKKELSIEAFEWALASPYATKEESMDPSLVFKTLGGDLV